MCNVAQKLKCDMYFIGEHNQELITEVYWTEWIFDQLHTI